jgi:hypothetical protein
VDSSASPNAIRARPTPSAWICKASEDASPKNRTHLRGEIIGVLPVVAVFGALADLVVETPLSFFKVDACSEKLEKLFDIRMLGELDRDGISVALSRTGRYRSSRGLGGLKPGGKIGKSEEYRTKEMRSFLQICLILLHRNG